MENVKIWLLSFGCALFLTSIFKLIISETSLKKTANIFFSVFIIVYMLVPIKSLNYKKDFMPNTETEYGDADVLQNGYDALIENAVNEVCVKNSVEIVELLIKSNVNENGEYTVSKIELKIDSKDKIENIKSALEKELGFEVTVT